MSDYAASVLAKGQAVATSKFNEAEQRVQNPSVMALALKNQSISIPDAQALRLSPLRPVDVNLLTKVQAGTAVAKSAFHTGTYGDSSKINVLYVSHVETMQLPRKLAYNNIFSYQTLFDNLYEQKWKNLRTRHDNTALAFLLNNRCQLDKTVINPQIASAGFGDSGTIGSWDNTNYAGVVNSAYSRQFLQYAKSFMDARHFSGEYDIIADLQMAAQFQFEKNQGAGNATNTAYQFNNETIAVTQQSVSSFYPKGSIIVMPKGALAGLVWNEGANIKGVNAGENNIGSLGTTSDPLGSGAIADISMYVQRGDTSGIITGGSTQDIIDNWEMTLTVGYVTSPLSTASDSVIHLFGQA